ncbi:malto-oligosyltrehalose trehalohydrolase [Pigmentiphaga soli]|uniref:Malto-oligosyltrehalose trehalohydrolase n=1 Tax=Pigmentiphaga soli TaxID=1007095 RepID=A0ABP8H6U8_9BURK
MNAISNDASWNDFGATLLGPASTRFRLWAPGVDAASLEYEGAAGFAELPMQPTGGGWYETVAPCGAGTRYRYRVAGLTVPDPASRMQDGDVHDASVVADPGAYRWRCAGWRGRPWHETVLYEAHAGAFGGFAGLAAQLPRLAALGFTAIELMPIADFPGPRNWGYDGVLPYAPDRAYGTPDELKALIDRAHELGLMMFLDVVYNHFGPEGNYLHAYAPAFFRDDVRTPWGPAIDFRRPEVRRFFTGNALYWLDEFRFDGLRLDAVHAIADPGWLDEMAAEVRRAFGGGRHAHLVLEHDGNRAGHLERDFDAQWNDDGHHVLHHMVSGEADGYYGDYADAPGRHLARFLAEGFVYQGEPSPYRGGRPRGEPSAQLPPTAFVLFLQNHDQIGNRAFGERLLTLALRNGRVGALRAAVAVLLLSPQIPLVFMGDEFGAQAPFLYFTSHPPELAAAVREGRRQEFAHFPAFADEQARAAIPDPNAPSTFLASVPDWPAPAAGLPAQPDPVPWPAPAGENPVPIGAMEAGGARVRLPDDEDWTAYYHGLLDLRRSAIIPRLRGARSLGAQVLGPQAAVARWRLDDGAILALYVNFAADAVPLGGALPAGEPLFESAGGAAAALAQGDVAGAAAVFRTEQEAA